MTYRPRLIRITAGLIFAIAVLTIIQWAIGTRGWDLSAGLLTIVMVILGFWLVSVLLVRHEITKEFERSYPDQFEEKYGYLRTEVMKAIYSFLECGIPENGMVRVTYHLYHTQDITSLFKTKPEAIKASCSECKLFNREIFHRGTGD